MVLFMFDLQKDPQGIYTLYFDKPPANAFDDEALRALKREIESMAQDAQCRALIFAAKGRFFSAGADIAFMGRAMQGNDGPDKLELALACDFRVAEAGIKLGLPECKIGLLPGAGGTQRLSRLVGGQRAKRLIMTGEIISAEQAHGYGLIDDVVPTGQGERFCRDFCASMISVPKMTLASIKKCLDLAPSRLGFECEIEETYALQKSPETQQLITHFLQRSKQRN